MRVAVTGGTGFIGRHVVAALTAAGHEVVVVARRPVPVDGAVRVVRGDVASRDIAQALAGSEAIVHLAGLSDASQSLADPGGYTTINALGTLNVLEAARLMGAGMVFASSQRIYEPWHGPLHEDAPKVPTTVYGWSKLAAEGWAAMYSQIYGVPTIALRAFTVYGPGQRARGGASGVLAIFAERTLRGQELTIHQRHLRDFVWVGDTAAAFLRAVERLGDPQVQGRAYNLGCGVGTALDDLARLVQARSGIANPPSITLRDAAEREPREEVYATLDRIREELDWSPTVALEDGIDRYLAWLRDELAREGAA
jgi:UDP-glucose 4-epimerase